MFKYIIMAEGQKAFPVHTDICFYKFKKFIEKKCKESGGKLRIGINEYTNPQVMTVEDFVNFKPITL